MALHVRVLEPAKALDPKDNQYPGIQGYVGLAENGGSLFYPAVDTCMAIAFILDSGELIGGHLDKNGHPVPHDRVIDLMLANIKDGRRAKVLIFVGQLGSYRSTKGKCMMHEGHGWDAMDNPCLEIDTNYAPSGGVDVTVTADQVCLELCKDRSKKGTFQVPKKQEEGGQRQWSG